MMKHTYVICLLLLAVACAGPQTVLAQSSYRTKDGSVSVTAVYQGHLITAHSKQVQVILFYQISAFEFRLALADLHTGIDSLDHRLMNLTKAFVLKGKFSLDEITTTQHPPYNFVFSARLETAQGKISEIKGTGRLEHIDGGEEMACELAAYFDTTLNDLGFREDSRLDEQAVKVQFYKTILRRDSN